eukprot:TRINITY_DN58031_c0_g1_i1.p1 TRINITY_DN58031_c0_g1~~TRINITY_DN58031_c0_g1_i1.p1  ORF type:complete len:248 (+),score=39.57 TRINITY_DN58031_c0_g1_i1:145-888(+)
MDEGNSCNAMFDAVACTAEGSPWAVNSPMRATWTVPTSPGQGYSTGLAPQMPFARNGTPSESQHKRLSPSQSTGREDGCVEALLPKMKRMRLRPSIGQLRLQREAKEAHVVSQGVQLFVESEQLRATVRFDAVSNAAEAAGCEVVQFQLLFPPQYPHRPPAILQVEPQEHFSFWQYHGQRVGLFRVSDACWSPVMGLADVVRDLIEELRTHGISSQGVDACPGVCSQYPAIPLPVSHSADPEEIEMT